MSELNETTEKEVIEQENRDAADVQPDNDGLTPETDRQKSESEQETAAKPKDEEQAPKPRNPRQEARERLHKKHKAISEGKDIEADKAVDRDDAETARIFGDKVEKPEDRRNREQQEQETADKATQEAAQRDPDPATVAQAPETRKRVLKVHGQDREFTEEEVLDLARQAVAAGNILEGAKQARAEQQQILDELRAARAKQTPEQREESNQQQDQHGNPTDAELDEIIDQIQVGSPEEAKAALNKFGDNIVQRVQERIGDIDQSVEQAMSAQRESQRRTQQLETIMTDFESKYTEFKDSRPMQAALAQESEAQMYADLKAAGVEDATIQGIQRQHNQDAAWAITYAHRRLRESGVAPGIRDFKTILSTSADNIRKVYGAPRTEEPSAQVSEDRVERKRNLSPQPSRATATPTAETKQVSQEEARKNAVRQMRQQRRGR